MTVRLLSSQDVLARFLEHVDGVKQVSETKYNFRCPVHPDSTPSATCLVGDKGLQVRCHAGSCNADARQIVEAVGLRMSDLFWTPYERNGNGNGNGGHRNGNGHRNGHKSSNGHVTTSDPAILQAIAAAARPNGEVRLTIDQIEALPGTEALYLYRDPNGQPNLLVRRYWPEGAPKKQFSQYHASGDGWVSGVPKGYVLYPWRVEAVRAAAQAGRTVYVAEGEKCVLALEQLGVFPSTCNPMGSGKWKREGSEYAEHFRGASLVVIMADPDDAGRKHAATVARSLYSVGVEARIIEAPVPAGIEPARAKKWDVADWANAGGDAVTLFTLAANAAPWKPSAAELAAEYAAEDRLHCTDLGNAKRLIRQHGENIRFCDGIGWLVWDGCRMRVDRMAIKRCAQQTAEQIELEARADDLSKKERKKLEEWAHQSEFDARLNAMERRAEPLASISPDQLDRDPFLLNVRNGTIDLRTCSLRSPRQSDLITKLSPVTYDPAATCPLWLQYLEKVMAGNVGLMSFLQRVAGYALTASVAEECMFILYGHGRNGKGTFVETLVALLGSDYARRLPSEMLLDNAKAINGTGPTPDLANLKGARMSYASEVEEGRRLREAWIKEITGGDTITARFLRENPIEFAPTHKLFYGVNHKPQISGTDEGIWSRIRLIPFTVFIPEEERDKELKAKLFRNEGNELPGILNWALAGCLEWQRIGLDPPREVVDATDEYRKENDTAAEFIKECCDVGSGFQVPMKTLFAEYLKWCSDNNARPIGKRSFGDYLTSNGFPSKEGHSRERVRTGLCISSPASSRPDPREPRERDG